MNIKFSFLRFTVLRYNIRYRCSLPFSTSRNRNRLSRYVIHSCFSFSVKAVDLFWNFSNIIYVWNLYFLLYIVRKIIFSSKKFENLSKIVNCDWQLGIRYVDRSKQSRDGQLIEGWRTGRLDSLPARDTFPKISVKIKINERKCFDDTKYSEFRWQWLIGKSLQTLTEMMLATCWKRFLRKLTCWNQDAGVPRWGKLFSRIRVIF